MIKIQPFYPFFESLKTEKTFDDFPAGYFLGASDTKEGIPSVKLYRTFGAPVVCKGDELKTLKDFVISNGFPLIEEITGTNFQRFVDSGLPVAVLFSDFSNKEENEKNIATVKLAAETLKGKFNFAYTNGVTYKEQLVSMGGNGDKLPAIAAMDILKRLNFPYSGSFDEKSILTWAQGILSGEIKPFLKTQPVPEKQDGPVYVLVGKSFEEIVFDKTKDVLVEFYAPWCGHCKSLEPIYNKLATATKDVKNLIIAKIDATENDTPISVEGFPTIYFFPSDNKKPVLYDSGRTVSGFVKYLQEKSVASKEQLASVVVGPETEVPEKTEHTNEDLSDDVEEEDGKDKPKHDEL